MKHAKQSPRPLSTFWALPVFAALAVGLVSCGGSSAPEKVAAETVSGLRVESVRTETVADEIEAPGTVTSAATAQVSARTMGTVTAVLVKEGDAVKAGQVLVELDDRELAARRSAAQAALREAVAAGEEAARAAAAAEAQADMAKKTYDRFAYLREQKSVSPQEFDEVAAKQRAADAQLGQARARQQQVESMKERAQAELRAAETTAGYTRITAPFAGVVVRRMVEPGSMAAPGVPLLIVEAVSQYRLEVAVEASASNAIRRGTKARVELDALPGKSFEGTVVEIEAGADPTSHTVRARIDLPRDAAVRSGLFGRAWFRQGERQALVVPRAAVVERGQLRGVYAVDAQGIARLRLVTLGKPLVERVEVLSGLSAGERIVTAPGNRELDGRKVGDAK